MNFMNPERHPRLHLPLPPDAAWRLRFLGPNLHEADVDEHVTIRVRALVAPSVEHTLWVEGIMREDLPSDVTLKPIAVQSMTSPIGWPLVFAHYEIHGPDGRVLEERAGAFYAIVHGRAEVVARLRGVTWRDREAQLKPYLISATVDWPDYDDDLVITQLGIRP